MKDIKKRITSLLPSIFVLIFFSFILRVLISFSPSFDVDMSAWIAWANRLRELGFAGFYSDDIWTQYTPGFLYILWVLGKLGIANAFVIKVTILFFEATLGYLLYKFASKKSETFGKVLFLLYFLNPAVIFIGSVWGQIDGILTLFMVLSVFDLYVNKSLNKSAFWWSIAFLIKPQAIAIVPVLALWTLVNKVSLVKIIKAAAISLGTLSILSIPFWGTRSIVSLVELVLSMGADYQFTSLFAFNVWMVYPGMWINDTNFVLWGALLYLTIAGSLIYIFLRRKKRNWFLLSGVFAFSFFLFPTRVHERYLYPFLVFYLFYIASLIDLSKIKKHVSLFLVSSSAYLVNIYYPFSYYSENYISNLTLENLANSLRQIVFLSYSFVFVALAYIKRMPSIKINSNYKRYFLFGILAFAFVTRLINLGTPENEYFDEVYHAFTARIVSDGDPKAWEWWNPHPEGYAYEWTHPPFAKLAMAGSMLLFGQNSFAWRLPAAIFGMGVVYLVYLIGRELFKSKEIGLIASAIVALDGLVLTMSRIGMNDIYLLFFLMLTFYLFLKEKYAFSALAFGFAISSKWSAVWLVPLLLLTFISMKRKLTFKLLFFAVIPPIIYLLSYFPMFVTGHDLSIWWGMQKQMWWYHTQLDAEHAYTSEWWSWPLVLRPVWLYVSRVGDTVANIYAMSNPVLLWGGLISVVIGFYEMVVKRNRKLALVIFGWMIFFVPWAISPRIMFFYHYLPAIPFLALATAYVMQSEPKVLKTYLILSLLVFIYFFPHWTGIHIPNWLAETYYWLPSWR